MCDCIKVVSEQNESKMGKKPTDSYLDVIHESNGQLQLVEEEVQIVNAARVWPGT